MIYVCTLAVIGMVDSARSNGGGVLDLPAHFPSTPAVQWSLFVRDLVLTTGDSLSRLPGLTGGSPKISVLARYGVPQMLDIGPKPDVPPH